MTFSWLQLAQRRGMYCIESGEKIQARPVTWRRSFDHQLMKHLYVYYGYPNYLGGGTHRICTYFIVPVASWHLFLQIQPWRVGWLISDSCYTISIICPLRYILRYYTIIYFCLERPAIVKAEPISPIFSDLGA